MASPRTPNKSGEELRKIIDTLNQFGLDLPNPRIYSPWLHYGGKETNWNFYFAIQRLYYSPDVDVNVVINGFEEWVIARSDESEFGDLRVRSRPLGRGRSNRSVHAHGRMSMPVSLSSEEVEQRLNYLMKLIDDEIYLLNGGRYSPYAAQSKAQGPRDLREVLTQSRPSRRFLDDEEEEGEFHTAPNSPTKDPDLPRSTKIQVDDHRDLALNKPPWDGINLKPTADNVDDADNDPFKSSQRPAVTEATSDSSGRGNFVPSGPRTSFATSATSYITNFGSSRLDSFKTHATDDTEQTDSESMYGFSIATHLTSPEMKVSLEAQEELEYRYLSERKSGPAQEDIVNELCQSGPFSVEHPFKNSIPLRFRYELERIGRAWEVPLDQMLAGNSIPFKTYDEFWQWIVKHSQRGENPLPERSALRAWDSAVGDFKTERHSEAVVLTGDLHWCSEAEPGILKLNLNPLRIQRTCRFYRRFGSDRFLSLTIPAPSRPPDHLRHNFQPAFLRECMAMWLTQNEHRLLGRVWRPFYVEEDKGKRKAAEPRFKVEFFAVDGVDFNHGLQPIPVVAPARQQSDNHTPMSLEAFINWHMPPEANAEQSNCKLFQRLHLGLSKTFATVKLNPAQVLPLRHIPGRPVMNDGCALMSRSLANAICGSLGISGNTPSCFQGRIAGAKGLWMVDRHESLVSGDDGDYWIQISDSQLKIKPHPRLWKEPVDDDQLTFEVVNWSKPLRPAGLNVQLLAILEHGGQVKEYIGELTRAGIQALGQDFMEVLENNSNILCRSLVQKHRPMPGISSTKTIKSRCLEHWVIDNAECITRFSEAGFLPRDFFPLRTRLRKLLMDLLDRYVDKLHIEVPLSTYAYCIADPYGVLEEDEVHFGFSSQWRDPRGQFEDNLLDGMDILVGRLPAHFPSDIQRRRAVWKPELRHFKDVIVFSSKGNVPLAHMLSGGDYDGDTPWICWDQNIAANFKNSQLPENLFSEDHFGLTKHSIPMREVQSTDDFLHGAFLLNLALSNLGRCTLEHEKVVYDESIHSDHAIELACLLSHLVDGHKAGVHLSERAWQLYRKTISPVQRQRPAYKDKYPERKYKRSNITDYLKFEVARKERGAVLEQLERTFPESSANGKDEDLIRPWTKVWKLVEADKGASGDSLHTALVKIERLIDEFKTKWERDWALNNKAYGPIAQEAVSGIQSLSVPTNGDHPILQTWRNSPDEWQKALASCTYRKYPFSSFVLHAFGETLCRIKANCHPSRIVTNDILACYKVGRKLVQQITARTLTGEELLEGAEEAADVGDDEPGEFGYEYDNQEAAETFSLEEMAIPGSYGYYDFDDDDIRISAYGDVHIPVSTAGALEPGNVR
ncbi:hypothetical protein MPDQ_001774 [Monascus purpureus]|uniref:RNA-dependent RNA polymerase n=1 Tax=Monascus purpureus TaxID=5098 RepID=A0A507R2K4_MONPU|nr:hypothetical protein MPDQ_001774 [Monascus purpureus]BDD59643.1 hypothetical protein MAP00_004839 [Monascus purpureus]